MKHRIRVAGLVRRDDAILLVEQLNPENGHKRWTIPGGGLEPTDPDMFAGVVREIYEETGLHVRPGQVRYLSEYLSIEKEVLMLSVWIECHPVEESGFGEPHLENTLEDDYLLDIRWWKREELAGHNTSAVLQTDVFWDNLDAPLGHVTYLGRKTDAHNTTGEVPLLVFP